MALNQRGLGYVTLLTVVFVLSCSAASAENMITFYAMPSEETYYHADRTCRMIYHLTDEQPLDLSMERILSEYEECPYCLGTALEDTWNYLVSRETLEDSLDVLRLVNKENLLEKSYPDQDIEMYRLVEVTAPVTKGTHQLRAVANEALTEMIEAAKNDGIKLYVGSSYRSYRTQEVIHYNRKKSLGYDDGYTQVAGGSEHQTGLAADVISWEYRDKFQQSFGEKKEGIWLRENCARFGFIIRYPKGKEDITGVQYEPWHVRYVGTEVAVYIMESELTLEEFTEEYLAALSD